MFGCGGRGGRGKDRVAFRGVLETAAGGVGSVVAAEETGAVVPVPKDSSIRRLPRGGR